MSQRKNCDIVKREFFLRIVSETVRNDGFAQSYAVTGDRIAKTSRLLGMSVKEYQAFTSAASHAGMATTKMDSALRKLSVSVG